MEKQGETDGILRMWINSGNQGLGGRRIAEQRLRQIRLGSDAKMR
jgi:hypothetical protein